jgi:hypothetical protein
MAGRQAAEQQYNWSEAENNLLRIYSEILNH